MDGYEKAIAELDQLLTVNDPQGEYRERLGRLFRDKPLKFIVVVVKPGFTDFTTKAGMAAEPSDLFLEFIAAVRTGDDDRFTICEHGGYGHKRTVLSLVERGGKIKSFKLGGNTKAEIVAAIRANVDPASTLHTDGAPAYKHTLAVAVHEAVDHNKEYVRQGKTGIVHTNTLEGFFSVFKRGMVGTYQHCSEAHLHRYLSEFDFRYNNREALGCNDAARMINSISGIVGRRLTYEKLKEASI